ncbi:uncharacterized protein LOC115878068 [Sitophilus oryzae]|uniref:Uncharacterized protein LOC115878068 n=1 Tax=Sitophilus oryzae TaxID=7048 RepID=A0A6J2XGM6_SITOR|nr:uncharacterized protein LOC115878068 [Sitophilus oryzae]
MEETTSREEVIQAITEKVGTLQNTFQLSNLRPNANNTQAATIITDKETAHSLLQAPTLRIGIVRCSLERKADIKKCKRCWAHDHTEEHCNGPDRRKLCYKCSEEGHTVK